MVVLPNINGLIWDIEYRVADILNEFNQTQQIDISLNQEGPCAETLGLYQLLDYLTSQFGIEKNKITIHTCNQLEQHSEYQIKKYIPWYIPEINNFYNHNKHNFKPKTFDTAFKTFGLFIGRSNWVRLWLASEIFTEYRDDTVMTFHYNRDLEFHRPHCGVDELINQNVDLAVLDKIDRLLQNSPVTVDNIMQEYPMLIPSNLNIAKVYHNFFCEIVCETYFTGTSFLPSEKILRPIMLKTPFIVHGPQNYLKNLKRLGFKTFDQWWSEGYSEDPHNHQPVEILKIIEDLSKKPTTELAQMYQEMQPVLEHNLATLQSLTAKDFKIFGSYQRF
jgi:predicted nucleotidyltransferase